ncbi:MAG: citrate synthase [Oscillospiraceae bacterium]|nr:citrate synthase [Oscillospiraceae bacterium]
MLKLGAEERDALEYLCGEYKKHNKIDAEDWSKYDVKRGLRNSNGTGVLVGLTSICDVVGYEMENGERRACDGKLIYRGIDVKDIIEGGLRDGRYLFEEVSWLLLFGRLPDAMGLEQMKNLMSRFRELPEGFAEDMIMKAPSRNIMNKMARSVLALYSYDELAEDQSFENTMLQALMLISCLPTIMVYAYQVKRRTYDKKSMYIHHSKRELSTAQNILRTNRSNKRFEDAEARLLDLCLVLHADHGGGNNSAFTTRVLTSSATDTYSAIAAAIGSLKGPRHGGANIKVMEMLEDIKAHIKDWRDDEEIRAYLEKILAGEAGDGKGLIYGMGHPVYTKSDPRELILKESARSLALEHGLEADYNLLCAVERLAPEVLKEQRGVQFVCANVDLFSGLVFKTMEIPLDLYTPMFAVSRIAGWCAHLVEERLTGGRIIRPAYKYVGAQQRGYIPLEER